MGKLNLMFLGDAVATIDDSPIPQLRSKKAVALLCYLAVTGKPHSRSVLATLLWGEAPEINARASLRKVVAALRKSAGSHLIIDNESIAFDLSSPFWMDVMDLKAAAPQSNKMASIDEPTIERLVAAADLYQGEFLEGFYVRSAPVFEEWVLRQRIRLHDVAYEVFRILVDYFIDQGAFEKALHYGRRLLELEPWREEGHQDVMRLLTLTGQRSAALAQYDYCCQLLEDELGVEPSLETRALYEAIRDETFSAEPITESSFQTFSPPTPPAFMTKSGAAEDKPDVFVARDLEFKRLQMFLDRTLAEKGQLVFIKGEAGTGKTTLAAEFARRAQDLHASLLVVKGNCNLSTGLGDPYLPFRMVMESLTGDIEAQWATGLVTSGQAQRLWQATPVAIRALIDRGPDLVGRLVPADPVHNRAKSFEPDVRDWLDKLIDLTHRETADLGENGQQQFFNQYLAVLQSLTTQRPLLIIMDDLQWSDSASINLLFHLGKNLGNNRLLLIGAYRPDEVALGRTPQGLDRTEQHPLQKILGEFKRTFGDIWLDLDKSVANTGQDFINAFLDTEPNRLDKEFRHSLLKLTRGQPLFTVELLRAMQERGDLVQDASGHWQVSLKLDWHMLPARVEGVIEERIGRLEEKLLETLEVASVEGEEFTAQVIARVQEADERGLIRQLSRELEMRHHLINAQGSQQVGRKRLYRYRFQHRLFQQYIYDSLSQTERDILHFEVGNALERLHDGFVDEIAAILSWHFTQAGEAERAIPYLLKAGDRARDLHAIEEAIIYYEHALRFLKEKGNLNQAARTLMKLGLTYHTAFQYRRSQHAFEEGFALWQREKRLQTEEHQLVAPQVLRVGAFLPVTTLDPTRATDDPSTNVIHQLFSGLVALTPELDIIPELAHSWEVLRDGQEYVFHLREDAIWSDGTPVSAADFEFAWKRVLDPAGGSDGATLLFDIKGARAYHLGTHNDPDKIGVHSRDQTTLVVELEKPTSYFLNLLAYSIAYPVPQHIVDVHGQAWTEHKNLVCNGPFQVASWNKQKSLVMIRNQTFHGTFGGNIQEVELTVTVDPSERVQLYKDDQVDVVLLWGMGTALLERARQQHAGEYLSGPQLQTTFVAFDTSRPPFSDPRVRRAFVLGADREALANVVLQGSKFPVTGSLTPPGLPGHLPGAGLPYDPEQARRILTEAGYVKGNKFPSIESIAPHGAEPLCEYMQSQWQRNLGVEITWNFIDWSSVQDRLAKSLPHLFLLGWTADYPDADNFLRVGRRVSHWNEWHDERYDRFVETATRVTDQDKRRSLYEQAERILIEQAPIMPLVYGRLHLLIKPWVTRFPVSPIQYWFWKDVIIEPHGN